MLSYVGDLLENKNIIIVLAAVLIVLAFIAGMVFTSLSKEECNLIIPHKTISAGGSFVVVLEDAQENPVCNRTVNIQLVNDDGTKIDEDAVTNSKGKAKISVDDEGKYSVRCSFGGDDKYSSASITGELIVKKATTEVVETQADNVDSSSQNSQREEYQITSDGWNPREHEVSREFLDGGHERVKYDDGYFVIVDKDGNIITHGFA